MQHGAMESPLAALIAVAAVAVVTINLVAFAAFGIDKRLAEARERRISEATLLQLAFFGGTLGAYAGRRVFRHKTRKRSFLLRFWGVVGLQLAALLIGGFLGYRWDGGR